MKYCNLANKSQISTLGAEYKSTLKFIVNSFPSANLHLPMCHKYAMQSKTDVKVLNSIIYGFTSHPPRGHLLCVVKQKYPISAR